MKKLIAIVLVVAVLAMGSGVALAGNGNNAPPGPHYNLNIIGIPKGDGLPELNDNFTGGNGSRIFVSRTGTTQMYVYGGTSYAILDHDGTDGTVGTGRGAANAGIILPYASDQWKCDVYVRLVGPQTSSIRWKAEYWDGAWVHIATFTLNKSSKFSLKTSQLLADGFQDVLWTLDEKTKFRNLQVRIYVND